jgi:hypothetical protein
MQRISRVLAAAFDPNYHGVRAENEYLRLAHTAQDNRASLPGTWGRITGSDGRTVGVSKICRCGTCYDLDGMFEFMRLYACKACGHEINFCRDNGIDLTKMKAEDIDAKIAALPARPRVTQKQSVPFVDTWAQSSDDTVKWDGQSREETYSGLGGLEYSDPLAFSKHGK